MYFWTSFLLDMQLFVVSWEFPSAEDQYYANNDLKTFFDNSISKEAKDGLEIISWVQMPQDGTGLILCNVAHTTTLYKVFGPLRDRYAMTFQFKPGYLIDDSYKFLKNE